MKIVETPQQGKYATLADLKRLINRAQLLDYTDDAYLAVYVGRKGRVKELRLEQYRAED